MTQQLEKKVRESLKVCPNPIWFMKIQSSPFSYQPTPADFIVLSDTQNTLLEAKECTEPRFSFERLTQLPQLLAFEQSLNRNRSYIVVQFRTPHAKNQPVFLIPAQTMALTIKSWPKKSMNETDFNNTFAQHVIQLSSIHAFL